MYRVLLALPLSTTLILRERFSDEMAAKQAAARLPHGFVVLPESSINTQGALISVPFKEDPMQDLEKYENANNKHPEIGDHVWVHDRNVRGVILSYDPTSNKFTVGVLYVGTTINVEKTRLMVLPALKDLA